MRLHKGESQRQHSRCARGCERFCAERAEAAGSYDGGRQNDTPYNGYTCAAGRGIQRAKVGSPAETKTLRVRIPKGSPVRMLTSADISGDAFTYATGTTTPGAEYCVRVAPRSTQKPVLNRLIIRTDSSDARYAGYIVYLSVQP